MPLAVAGDRAELVCLPRGADRVVVVLWPGDPRDTIPGRQHDVEQGRGQSDQALESPAAMITDRDLAIRALAQDRPGSEPAREHASRPLVTGEPDMDLEEAAALMVQHRIRRLPVVDGDELTGIVTLDDIAVRTGNLEVAQRMTQEVIEGALPGFFFHERG